MALKGAGCRGERHSHAAAVAVGTVQYFWASFPAMFEPTAPLTPRPPSRAPPSIVRSPTSSHPSLSSPPKEPTVVQCCTDCTVRTHLLTSNSSHLLPCLPASKTFTPAGFVYTRCRAGPGYQPAVRPAGPGWAPGPGRRRDRSPAQPPARQRRDRRDTSTATHHATHALECAELASSTVPTALYCTHCPQAASRQHENC